jgi:HK97 gp10 family phage protein
MPELRIEGLSAVQEKLKQLPADMARKVFTKALRSAGKVMKAEMVSRAPVRTEDVGPNSDSLPVGAVKANITSRVSIKPADKYGRVTIGPNKVVAHVVRWLETGWILTGHKPGKRRIKNIPARPFVRPSADAAGQQAVDALTETLRTEIEKLWTGGTA